MQVDFYGLQFLVPRVTCYLWSPWRASALEHRLFDMIRQLPGVKTEQDFDELRAHIQDAKLWKQAHTGIVRVLKGWQEEASDGGRERRHWRWLMEGDTDEHGYDHAGEPAGLWLFLQFALDRSNLEDGEKAETIDLNGFGVRIWPQGVP